MPRRLRLIEQPDAVLVQELRCGRWKRDGARTKKGGTTRKAEALARLAEAEAAGKVDVARLELELVESYRKAGARCRVKVKQLGAACSFHGGDSPWGPESPSWKHGEDSYRVPQILGGAYRRFLEGRDVATLEPDLALAKGLTQAQLDRYQEAGDARTWRKRAVEAMQALDAAMKSQKPEAFDAAWAALQALLTEGAKLEDLEASLERSQRSTARLSRAETIRRRQAETMVPVSLFLAVVYELRDAFAQALAAVAKGARVEVEVAAMHQRIVNLAPLRRSGISAAAVPRQPGSELEQ